MKRQTESEAENIRFRFSVNQLLLAITVLAVPISLISKYWVSVNNTVDERTIPFANAGLWRQSFFVVGLLLLGILAIVFITILLKRRLYLPAVVCALTLAVCVWPLSRQIESKILSPVQGNEIAEIHNDAAAIVATAIDRLYARTQRWPRTWADLDDDLSGVISEINNRRPQSTDPFGSGDPFASDATSAEESQSIFSRSPDLASVTREDIHSLVDVDFDAQPLILAKQNWMEFSGIIPHKPTYNTYRVEFGKLIKRLNEATGSPEMANTPTK